MQVSEGTKMAAEGISFFRFKFKIPSDKRACSYHRGMSQKRPLNDMKAAQNRKSIALINTLKTQ